MSYSFLDPWYAFLPREGGHILSVMGSGGKTSLLWALAKVYKELDIPVVLTTTTQNENISDFPKFEVRTLAAQVKGGSDLRDMPPSFFLYDGQNTAGKLVGLSPDMVDELGAWFPNRVILVEVDGSAKLPIKIHRCGEPVWPLRTSLALVVMGVTAVGEPVGNVVHRFGRQPSTVFDELEEWENLEWGHLQDILLGAGGYLEQVPDGIPTMLVLTGMDEQDDSIGLFSFVGQAMESPKLPLVVFCDFGTEEGEIKAACRLVSEAEKSESLNNE